MSRDFAEFFDACRDANIRICIWKNLYDLYNDNSENVDIDLWVLDEDRKKFNQLLEQFTVLDCCYAHSRFDEVKHIFMWDNNNLKFRHLHVYFKLITGHTWIKEFRLEPPKDWFESCETLSLYDVQIPVLENSHLRALNEIRVRLKRKSILNYIYYKYDQTSYQNEAGYLARAKDRILFEHEVNISRRIGRVKSVLLIYGKLMSRLALPTKYRKRKFQRGLIIAVSGVDGAGKTTIVNSIYEIIKAQKLAIKVIKPGRIKKIKSRNVTNVKVAGFKKIKALALAVVRLIICNVIGGFYRKMGYLVISERWPGKVIGQMDSPRINSGVLGRLEYFIYRQVRLPELFVFLSVPVRSLLQRNQDRNKKGKETDLEIVMRFKENSDFVADAEKVVVIENSHSAHQGIQAVVKEIAMSAQ